MGACASMSSRTHATLKDMMWAQYQTNYVKIVERRDNAASEPVGGTGTVKRLALGGAAIEDDLALYLFGVDNASAFSYRVSEHRSQVENHTSMMFSKIIIIWTTISHHTMRRKSHITCQTSQNRRQSFTCAHELLLGLIEKSAGDLFLR